MAAALSVREDPGRPLVDSIAARFGATPALLIVDNCEHVLDAAAALAATLLSTCPSLRILATSQSPLGVAGEASWPVPPLTLAGKGERDPAAVGAAEAARLLCDRGALIRHGFSITSDNAGAIADICRRLDGIPLAIELAAARLNTLTPVQLAARLDDRFGC